MSELAKVLNTMLKKLDISVSELSRQTGIGQPVIHRLATGNSANPTLSTLRPIAEFFKISLSQLVGDAPLPDLNKNNYSNLISIPLVSMQEINQPNPEPIYSNPNSTVLTNVTISKYGFASLLEDSSMEPKFPAKTLVIIDPNVPYQNKDYVMVAISGKQQAIFKQILLNGDDNLLKPLNPDFPIIHLSPNDRILGTMIQARITTHGQKGH